MSAACMVICSHLRSRDRVCAAILGSPWGSDGDIMGGTHTLGGLDAVRTGSRALSTRFWGGEVGMVHMISRCACAWVFYTSLSLRLRLVKSVAVFDSTITARESPGKKGVRAWWDPRYGAKNKICVPGETAGLHGGGGVWDGLDGWARES